MGSALVTDLLDALDQLAGGIHAGFRLGRAKGLMCDGTFHPSREAAVLTRAPHTGRPAVRCMTGTREETMIWLVLWSFVMALTPVALGLAWKATSAIGRRIGLGLARAVESAEPWRSLHLFRFDRESSSVSMTGRTRRLGTGRSWAPERRRASRS